MDVDVCPSRLVSPPVLTQPSHRRLLSDDGDGDNHDDGDGDGPGQGLDLSEFFESTEGCFTTPQVTSHDFADSTLLSFGQ